MNTTESADARIPGTHPFARHLRAVVHRRSDHRPWTPADGPLPALFLSHGLPSLLENLDWMRQLHGWAHALPRPRAVLIVSAHWETDAIGITSTSPAELVYDFNGFPAMFHRMRYDTPENRWLAERLTAVLPDTTHVHEHRGRGLDHGAWVPLKAMYPEADIPVLQMSLPTGDPDTLLRLGERLRRLREEGVLVIGSGSMTHGLAYTDRVDPDHIPRWSAEFDAWAAAALDRGDIAELREFRTRGPGVDYAHPTAEHFTPLFVTLGAATDPQAGVRTTIGGYVSGLSRRSFQVA